LILFSAAVWLGFRRLGRKSLAITTPSEPTLVASFTTYGPRKFHAFFAILHALATHKEVSRFYLTIGYETQLPLRFFLLRLIGLRILRGEERFGPYLRLVEVAKLEPASVIITLDDDSLYPETTISSLVATHRDIPSAIVGMRGCKVPAGRSESFAYAELTAISDRDQCVESGIFLTCSGGSLYPPVSRFGMIVDWEMALRLSPRNDDIWYFFAAEKEGIPMVLAAGEERNPKNLKGSQDNALWRTNVLEGHNDKFLAQCRDHFRQADRSISGN